MCYLYWCINSSLHFWPSSYMKTIMCASSSYVLCRHTTRHGTCHQCYMLFHRCRYAHHPPNCPKDKDHDNDDFFRCNCLINYKLRQASKFPIFGARPLLVLTFAPWQLSMGTKATRQPLKGTMATRQPLKATMATRQPLKGAKVNFKGQHDNCHRTLWSMLVSDSIMSFEQDLH